MLIAFHVYSSEVLIDYGESQVSEERTNATSSQYTSSANFIHYHLIMSPITISK